MDSLLYGAEIPGHGRVSFEHYGVPQDAWLSDDDGALLVGWVNRERAIASEHQPIVAKILEARKPLFEQFQRARHSMGLAVIALFVLGEAAAAMAVGADTAVICILLAEFVAISAVVERRRRPGGICNSPYTVAAIAGVYLVSTSLACQMDGVAAASGLLTMLVAAAFALATPFFADPIIMDVAYTGACLSAAFWGFTSLAVHGRAVAFWCLAAVVPLSIARCSRELFVPRRRCAALVVWDAVRARCGREKRE